ncbi:hypothetical protein [Pseudonocardia sp. TRM90224]|uniref:hypothetical protein n=1 Tax=Pseudonocardia sp. TRM90224 TaxID=2812678 RepID=UPI001E2E4A78|nr:hypothetical protein [Pseudonocardia sp. TRM90224]
MAEETLADRIRHLMEHPAGRAPYTEKELVDGLAKQGTPFSPQYVNQLVTGSRPLNPTYDRLLALIKFFRIPAGRLFPGYDDVSKDDLVLLAAMRDPDVLPIVTGLMKLGPEARRSIGAIVSELNSLEERTRPPARRKRRTTSTD